MKKLVIISLDLLLAFPVLAIAFILLFSSIKGSQNYLSAIGVSQAMRLNAFVGSQQLASTLDTSTQNYSNAELIITSTSKNYNLTSNLIDESSTQSCDAIRTLCRLVTVSGRAYLLVLSYENSS